MTLVTSQQLSGPPDLASTTQQVSSERSSSTPHSAPPTVQGPKMQAQEGRRAAREAQKTTGE